MILAPTKDAIGFEIMWKKTWKVENCHYDIGMSC